MPSLSVHVQAGGCQLFIKHSEHGSAPDPFPASCCSPWPRPLFGSAILHPCRGMHGTLLFPSSARMSIHHCCCPSMLYICAQDCSVLKAGKSVLNVIHDDFALTSMWIRAIILVVDTQNLAVVRQASCVMQERPVTKEVVTYVQERRPVAKQVRLLQAIFILLASLMSLASLRLAACQGG